MAADLRGEMSHGHDGSVCRFDSLTVVPHLYPVQAVVLLKGDVEKMKDLFALDCDIWVSTSWRKQVIPKTPLAEMKSASNSLGSSF